MNQIATTAIVLARTNYGEADRIITVLTPQYGKLRLIAKGVRRVKSRLAGGIELFSVSEISFIRGRGDISTLVSARLQKHYGAIVRHLDRVQLGYDLIKLLNTVIEDEAESEYFDLLERTFQGLDDEQVQGDLIRAWFIAQLLRLGGHLPNLRTDAAGAVLSPDETYAFDFATMSFALQPSGHFHADHIKFLRLLFSANQPKILQQVTGGQELLPDCSIVIQTMLHTCIHA
jgi:DNA repair protein RecO (recombination protein O)